MNTVKKNIILRVLVGLVIIGVSMIAAYNGFLLWIRYAKSEFFTGEVNAAIITGIIGLLTLIGSVIMSIYSTKQAKRINIRDELLKKRFEIYSELVFYSENLFIRLLEFFANVNDDDRKRIRDLREDFSRFLLRNRLFFSRELEDAASFYESYIRALTFVRSHPQLLDEYFTEGKLKAELPKYYHNEINEIVKRYQHSKIIRVDDTNNILHMYFYQIHWIIREELGLYSVEKEIKELSHRNELKRIEKRYNVIAVNQKDELIFIRNYTPTLYKDR